MQRLKLLVVLLVLQIGLMVWSSVQAQADQPIPLPLGANDAIISSRAGVELLSNTSFETDVNGDHIPDDWVGKRTQSGNTDRQKCDKPEKLFANSGACAFLFRGNSEGSTSKLTQTISNLNTITQGSTLTLSAFVDDSRSGQPGSTIATAKVTLSNGSTLKLKLRLPEGASSGYAQLSDSAPVDIPASVSVVSATVAFLYKESAGKYLVDDASLMVTAPNDETTPTSTATPVTTQEPTTEPTAGPTFTATPTSPANIQLLANDGLASDVFGCAVSLSADGDTALVGALYNDVGSNDSQGSAYVYTLSGDVWTQQTQLLANDGEAFDNFGFAVSLSADGNTALVGAPQDQIGINTGQGSAYIFIRSGDTWTQQVKLTASSGEVGDEFGTAVSLSADGSTALVGSVLDDVGANFNQGGAYVFVRSGTTWTQQTELVPSDGAADDFFGSSVSLSGDGNTALVGSSSHQVGANDNQGSAYVFTRSGTAWTEQTQLLAEDGVALDFFGFSVSLSADGNTALAGAFYDDVGTTIDQGSAYVFTRSGTSWVQQTRLVATDGAAFDELGLSVSLSADGNSAIVASRSVTVGTNTDQGSAYIFTRSGTTWIQQTQLLAPDGTAEDLFGYAVSLSGDAELALVGAFSDDVGANKSQGSAWVFALP